MKKIACIFISLLFTNIVSAANWLAISTNQADGIDTFIDVDAIGKTKDSTRVWVRTDVTTNYIGGELKAIKSIKTHYEFSCDREQFRRLGSSVILKNGSIDSDYNVGEWKYPVPDSIPSHLYLTICKTH